MATERPEVQSSVLSARPGRLLRPKAFIYRKDVQRHPTTLFMFGDNLRREGYGGQAREMRGEPNVVGVPTKVAPARDELAYFRDVHLAQVAPLIDEAFVRADDHLTAGGDVVIPAGLGTGEADLPRRAPLIHDYILRSIADLEARAREGQGAVASPE